jgi:GH24 family phage-related lysozyme (muramidase)
MVKELEALGIVFLQENFQSIVCFVFSVGSTSLRSILNRVNLFDQTTIDEHLAY